jgi:hypothetical protein
VDVEQWRMRLLQAAEKQLDADSAAKRIERSLTGAFKRAVAVPRISRRHDRVDKIALAQLEPKLVDELQRRMFAAAEAVDGDRRIALERVQQRFMGLATSGRQPTAAKSVGKAITKAAKDAKAHERMVMIDQGKKLMANLDEIVAADNGSIGGFWDATWEIERKHRPEHAERHQKFYVRRGSWADTDGLVRHAEGYMDEHDMPGALINCRCEYIYVYDLSDCPEEALTAKGRKAA